MNSDTNAQNETAKLPKEPLPPGFIEKLIGWALLFATVLLLYLIVSLWPEQPSGPASYAKAVQEEQFAQQIVADIGKLVAEAEALQKNVAAKPEATAAEITAQAEKLKKAKADLKTAQDKLDAASQRRISLAIEGLAASSKDDACTRFCITEHARLILVVTLAGAFGAVVGAARNFAWHLGQGDYDARWRWWYALRIPVGMGLAFIAYASLRSAFGSWDPVNAISGDGSVKPYPYVAIGGLAGLFANEAHTKLKKILEAILTKGETKKPAGTPPDTTTTKAGTPQVTTTAKP
jgi:ElaB/YqjD/DUF883 family membrane-anchored ribosome-binding protein